MGAILPDVPIFLFYFLMKFGYRLPPHQIWTEVYYQPYWQAIFSTFHSIPLAVIGIAIAHSLNWKLLEVGLISVLLHCLLDLPVHNNDAHRHFFPFSKYRFISPISDWDRKRYVSIVAFGEIFLVFLTSIYLFLTMRSHFSQGLLVAVNLFYWRC